MLRQVTLGCAALWCLSRKSFRSSFLERMNRKCRRRFVCQALTASLLVVQGKAAGTAGGSSVAPLTLVESIEAIKPETISELMNIDVGVPSSLSGLPQGRWALALLHQASVETGMISSSIVAYSIPALQQYVNGPATAPNPVARTLLTFQASPHLPSDHRRPIANVTWSIETRELIFLGTRHEDSDTTQVFALNLGSGELKQLTADPQPIESFVYSGETQKLIFLARRKMEREPDSEIRYVVGAAENVPKRLREIAGFDAPQFELRYFIKDLRTGRTKALATGRIDYENFQTPLFLSPDGRWCVHLARPKKIAERWLDSFPSIAENPLLPAGFFRDGLPKQSAMEALGGNLRSVVQFYLADTDRQITLPLMDAPASYRRGALGEENASARSDPCVAWSSDGQFVFIANTYMLGEGADGTTPVVARIDLATGKREKVCDLVTPKGEPSYFWVKMRDNDMLEVWRSDLKGSRIILRKQGSNWRAVSTVAKAEVPDEFRRSAPDFFVNVTRSDWAGTFPELQAIDRSSNRTRVISEFNISLNHRLNGRAESIAWTNRRGEAVSGADAIILPNNYQPGKQYPLVIQVTPAVPFVLDPLLAKNVAAYPGRLFAENGVLVLNSWFAGPLNPENMAHAVEHYEDAISELVKRGMVDPRRVGIIGFSAAGNHVYNVISKAKCPIAVAAIIDSNQNSPWVYVNQYGSMMTAFDSKLDKAEFLVGRQFLGEGVERWSEQSPFFSLDAIKTPILFEGHNAGVIGLVPASWDTYAVLKRAQRPVEYAILPHAIHDPQWPMERFASTQGILDWCLFWLNGTIRLTPTPHTPETTEALAEQYTRWKVLYAQQQLRLEELVRAGWRVKDLPELPHVRWPE